MFPFIEKLKAHNKRKHQQNKEKFKEIGRLLKGEPKPDPTLTYDPNSYGIEKPVDAVSETAPVQEKVLTEQSIRKEQLRAERQEKLEAIREKGKENARKMNALNPGKRKVVNLVFLGIATCVGFLAVGFDFWPGSFFSRLEFNQGLGRKDMWIRMETAFTIYLMIFPIQYFILRKMANKEDAGKQQKDDVV